MQRANDIVGVSALVEKSKRAIIRIGAVVDIICVDSQ